MRPARRFALASLALSIVLALPRGSTRADEPAPPADAAQGEPVRCPIKGEIRIVTLVRSGEHVKKGDLLCALDTIALREQLVAFLIAFRGADAAYLNAKLTREVAEIATEEQEEAVIPSDLSQRIAAVALAKTGLALANQVLAEANAQGKPQEQRTKAEANIATSKTRLEQAQTNLDTFKSTIPKRKQALQFDIARCKADEANKRAAKEAAETRVNDIRRQIELCRIVAPSDGRIIHPRPDPEDVALGFGAIEEGSIVHQRQILCWFVPDPPAPTPMPKSPAGK